MQRSFALQPNFVITIRFMTTIVQEDETYEMNKKKRILNAKHMDEIQKRDRIFFALTQFPYFCVTYRHSSLESLVEV